MRNLVCLLILFIIHNCSSNSNTDELLKMGIKGKPKKVITANCWYNSTSENKDKIDTTIVQTVYFDQNGFFSKSTINSPRSNRKDQCKYIYDSNNRIIKQISNDLEITYLYDDTLLISNKGIGKYDNYEQHLIETYHYDTKNKLKNRKTKQFSIDLDTKDTTFMGVGIFTYNSKGFVIEANWEEVDSFCVTGKEIYKLNSDGLRIEKKEVG